ncbi:hypothetical protein NUH87_30835 [Pseudomonas batumici]|uniref:hypothetical protein n=1 Tax=Pseudomonas batumici TaxID=226910 RepID=UPI0030D50699
MLGSIDSAEYTSISPSCGGGEDHIPGPAPIVGSQGGIWNGNIFCSNSHGSIKTVSGDVYPEGCDSNQNVRIDFDNISQCSSLHEGVLAFGDVDDLIDTLIEIVRVSAGGLDKATVSLLSELIKSRSDHQQQLMDSANNKNKACHRRALALLKSADLLEKTNIQIRSDLLQQALAVLEGLAAAVRDTAVLSEHLLKARASLERAMGALSDDKKTYLDQEIDGLSEGPAQSAVLYSCAKYEQRRLLQSLVAVYRLSEMLELYHPDFISKASGADAPLGEKKPKVNLSVFLETANSALAARGKPLIVSEEECLNRLWECGLHYSESTGGVVEWKEGFFDDVKKRILTFHVETAESVEALYSALLNEIPATYDNRVKPCHWPSLDDFRCWARQHWLDYSVCKGGMILDFQLNCPRPLNGKTLYKAACNRLDSHSKRKLDYFHKVLGKRYPTKDCADYRAAKKLLDWLVMDDDMSPEVKEVLASLLHLKPFEIDLDRGPDCSRHTDKITGGEVVPIPGGNCKQYEGCVRYSADDEDYYWDTLSFTGAEDRAYRRYIQSLYEKKVMDYIRQAKILRDESAGPTRLGEQSDAVVGVIFFNLAKQYTWEEKKRELHMSYFIGKQVGRGRKGGGTRKKVDPRRNRGKELAVEAKQKRKQMNLGTDSQSSVEGAHS